MPQDGVLPAAPNEAPQSEEAVTFDISPQDAQTYRVGQPIRVILEGEVGMVQTPPPGAGEGAQPMMGIKVLSKVFEDPAATNEFEDLGGGEADLDADVV